VARGGPPAPGHEHRRAHQHGRDGRRALRCPTTTATSAQITVSAYGRLATVAAATAAPITPAASSMATPHPAAPGSCAVHPAAESVCATFATEATVIHPR
jgi:hypothetical protein